MTVSQMIQYFDGVVCSLICLRIMLYRRDGATYKPVVTFVANLLAAMYGANALAIFMGAYHAEGFTYPSIVTDVILCCALFHVRGNVAWLLPCEFNSR